MRQAKIAMYAQIAYMIGMGTGFLFIPSIVLPMFGFDAPTDVWIRVLGILALVLASYYYICTKQEFLPFFKASVYGRYVFCASLAALAFLGLAQAPLYLFAALEAGLAAWAHVSLRSENLM